MVETLEVGEQVVSKPLKRLLVGVFQDVVLPDEAIFRVVERMELVKQQPLVSFWRLDEVHYYLELSEGRILAFRSREVFQ